MGKPELAALLRQVRGFARQPYAWPGGYPLVLVMRDGEVVCSKCARENYRLISAETRAGAWCGDWRAAGVEVHWEGEAHTCGHCGANIDSAYGEVQP